MGCTIRPCWWDLLSNYRAFNSLISPCHSLQLFQSCLTYPSMFYRKVTIHRSAEGFQARAQTTVMAVSWRNVYCQSMLQERCTVGNYSMEGAARISLWGHQRWLAWRAHLGIHESARHKTCSYHMYIFEQCEGVVFRRCQGSPRDLWWLLDTSAAICFTMTLFPFTFSFQSVFSHFESTAQWRTLPGRRERSLTIVAGPKPWSLFLCKGILFSHHHREH